MSNNKGNIPAPEEIVEAPEKEEEFSYDEIHKKSPEELAIDEKKEEPREEPKDEIKEEVKEEIKEDKGVEFDPQKMVDEISARVLEKLNAPPESKDKVSTEVKDEYELFAEKTLKDTGKPPTWKDALEFLKGETVRQIKLEQEEQVKQVEAEKKEERKVNETLIKKVNELVDEELDELYARNELTPIKDKKNPSDQGVIERKALFQKMLELNQERAAEGKQPIISIQRVFYGYYKKPSAQPAGEDAPISMGKGSVQGKDEEELDYIKDVRSKGWNFFKRG